jgi:hypothetical protein
VVHTSGSGGETIQKRFHVTTNDPRTPSTQLIVTGKVNPIIHVTPPFVRIMGRTGRPLTAEVHLKPTAEHPFTILEAKMWQGREIGLEVQPLGQDPARDGYRLRVRNLQTAPGVYRDYIVIKTDLKEKSSLNVPVYVRIYPEGQPLPKEPPR